MNNDDGGIRKDIEPGSLKACKPSTSRTLMTDPILATCKAQEPNLQTLTELGGSIVKLLNLKACGEVADSACVGRQSPCCLCMIGPFGYKSGWLEAREEHPEEQQQHY